MPLRIFPSTKSTSTIFLRPPISTSYLSRRSTIFSTCSVVIVFSSLINSMRSELRVIFRSSFIQRGVRTVRSTWATRWRTRRQKTADSGARRLKQDPGARWTPRISRSITSGASCRRTPESELSFRSFSGLSDCQIVDSHLPLERLRAVKTPDELALIREASDRVVEAMLTTFAHCCPGITKRDVTARLRQEELNRGLNFDYCLITAGSGPNRAPSDQVINSGDIISLDSGGRYGGYIGDLCRMGIAGRPDAELDDLLGWVEAVQQAARTPIRSGMLGKEIFAAVKDVLSSSPHSANTHFVAHGVGVIGHEAPRLSDRGPVTYPAYDANLPLQAGMVLSIETTLMHPRRGFIKLEDTVAVTETGWDAFGDKGRGWNCGDPPMMSPGPDQHQ